MLIESSGIQAIRYSGLEKNQSLLLPKKKHQNQVGKQQEFLERQQEFLEIVAEDPDKFCTEVRSWGVTEGIPPPVLAHKLSEQEYLELPWETEQIIASTWADLSVEMAARPGAWARIHIELIEKELISSSFLAASKKKQSGRDRINQVLKMRSSAKKTKQVEGCVRSVLRHLGGIVERGARSTYLDCPLAKAWWRHRYASEAQQIFSTFTIKQLSEALRPPGHWEGLIEAMVSRLTVIGDRNIRPALIIQLAESNKRSKAKVRALADAIGRHTAAHALGALSSPQVRTILRDEIAPIAINSK